MSEIEDQKSTSTCVELSSNELHDGLDCPIAIFYIEIQKWSLFEEDDVAHVTIHGAQEVGHRHSLGDKFFYTDKETSVVFDVKGTMSWAYAIGLRRIILCLVPRCFDTREMSVIPIIAYKVGTLERTIQLKMSTFFVKTDGPNCVMMWQIPTEVSSHAQTFQPFVATTDVDDDFFSDSISSEEEDSVEIEVDKVDVVECNQTSGFKVHVKMILSEGKTSQIVLEGLCDQDNTQKLKELIADAEGIPCEGFEIIFAGKRLEDDETLYECGVHKGVTLYVLVLGKDPVCPLKQALKQMFGTRDVDSARGWKQLLGMKGVDRSSEDHNFVLTRSQFEKIIQEKITGDDVKFMSDGTALLRKGSLFHELCTKHGYPVGPYPVSTKGVKTADDVHIRIENKYRQIMIPFKSLVSPNGVGDFCESDSRILLNMIDKGGTERLTFLEDGSSIILPIPMYKTTVCGDFVVLYWTNITNRSKESIMDSIVVSNSYVGVTPCVATFGVIKKSFKTGSVIRGWCIPMCVDCLTPISTDNECTTCDKSIRTEVYKVHEVTEEDGYMGSHEERLKHKEELGRIKTKARRILLTWLEIVKKECIPSRVLSCTENLVTAEIFVGPNHASQTAMIVNGKHIVIQVKDCEEESTSHPKIEVFMSEVFKKWWDSNSQYKSKQTEEAHLLNLMNESVLLKGVDRGNIRSQYQFFEEKLDKLYARANDIRMRIIEIIYDMQLVDKDSKSRAMLECEYTNLSLELHRLVGSVTGTFW